MRTLESSALREYRGGGRFRSACHVVGIQRPRLDGPAHRARDARQRLCDSDHIRLAYFDDKTPFHFQRKSEGPIMESKLIKGVIFILLGGVALAGTALADPSAEEIMQKTLLTTKVLDSTSGAEFVLINAARQQRIRDTDGQTKLIPGTTDNRRLVTFLSPADVRGTKMLLIEHSAV